jgi:hypothetical protein
MCLPAQPQLGVLKRRKIFVRCEYDTTSTAMLPALPASPASPCHLLSVLSTRVPSCCFSLIACMMQARPLKKISIYKAGSPPRYCIISDLRPASACTVDDLGFLRSVTGCLNTNFTLLPSNKNTIMLLYGAKINCILEILFTKVVVNKAPPSSILLQLSRCYYGFCHIHCSDKKRRFGCTDQSDR